MCSAWAYGLAGGREDVADGAGADAPERPEARNRLECAAPQGAGPVARSRAAGAHGVSWRPACGWDKLCTVGLVATFSAARPS